jgi:beta-glucosidase
VIPNPIPRRAWRRAGALAFAATFLFSLTGVATAATTDPNPSARETANAALSRRAATEGMVLLENHHALPIASSGTVAVYGVGAFATVKGGTGSGDVNNRATVSVRQGLEEAGYTVTTQSAYWDAMVAAYAAAGAGNFAAGEVQLTASTAQPTAATKTALYVVARNSGEGRDRTATKGDYYLTDTEQANLQTLGATYSNVVVVLNVGGVVDTSFFHQINGRKGTSAANPPLDGMLLMSQPGQEAGRALVDVLNGAVTPSGKTVDTWASSYDYYPASDTFSFNDGKFTPEIYSEGIYVGYRYFDSFYRSIQRKAGTVVNYPFGYGLSYTSFDVKADSVTADASTVTVRARVTNTGAVASGKDVVEVYFSAPTTGLDKPYQELAAYAKTDNLAPGQAQTVTMSFPTSEMSSYDQATAAYVLDPGSYLLRVGDSSRNTSVAAVFDLDKRVVTEQLSHQLDDETVDHGLVSDPADFYTYPTERAQIVHAPVTRLRGSAFTTKNDASPLEQTVNVPESSAYFPIDRSKLSTTTAYTTGESDWNATGAPYQPKLGETVQTVSVPAGATLYDVVRGTISMKQFVAGLSVEQLANIVEGGTGVPPTTPQPVGGAGATTARYESLGVPSPSLVDGPAGVRITRSYTQNGQMYYQFATAWPIGTMLAQTWNRDVIDQVGTAVGVEMQEFGATVWLAPGMNIHRDPLNGRNFEYYSEDPLVSGISATAMTEGVQSKPGLGVTIKHFTANNQEAERQRTDSQISERALREIYLKGFEIAVKSAQPMAVMTSYNLVNGTAASANYDLATDVLRGEWGYAGTVMTDFGANYETRGTLYSGNDLIEPGGGSAEVVNATVRPIDPTWDLAGLPVWRYASRVSVGNPIAVNLWSWGTFVPAPGGAVTYSRTVDSTTDLTQTPASGTVTGVDINFAGGQLTPLPPWNTVDNAYHYVLSQLDPNAPVNPIAIKALTPLNKAATTVTVNSRQNPADPTSPVTSYTVTVHGEHGLLRLGDLQRDAMRVLSTLTHTAPFAQLAASQGVSGITVSPYTALFAGQLQTFMSASAGPVVPAGR